MDPKKGGAGVDLEGLRRKNGGLNIIKNRLHACKKFSKTTKRCCLINSSPAVILQAGVGVFLPCAYLLCAGDKFPFRKQWDI